MDHSGQSTTSYSTIFHCTEDGFVCFLRFLEGVISLGMFVIFVRGYRIITNQKNNPISKQDKNIYLLGASQTLVLASYYLLFQEFFMLATLRNLLIWIGIHVFELLWQIYYIDDQKALEKVKKVLYVMMGMNFLSWFIIAVGDGSSLQNSNFNLGYNCRVLDWIVLSGMLLTITTAEGVLAYSIVDRLKWEEEQKQDKNQRALIKQQKEDIIMIVGGSLISAIIMFIWDYLSYMVSDTDGMCVEVFSGNTFFRKILCFLLKIISMQALPTITYYTIYYKRKSQFLSEQKVDLGTSQGGDLNDPLFDRAASDLNVSRMDSRSSLFSRTNSFQNL